MDFDRVVSWFSCGAASAYATYLAKEEYGKVNAVYCRVMEEHPDNLRFLSDFQKVTGIEVETIIAEKYNGSIYEVFKQKRFIKSQYGAPCTTVLKKDLRKKYQRPTDRQIFGYTDEEGHRVDRFIDSNNEVDADFILYTRRITKKECLRFILDLGIELPTMYKLGYSNNNCRGCVKGGMGYWNRIRIDFPDMFDRMAKLERSLNHSLFKDKDGQVFLDQLDPARGNLATDMPGDCGFTCELQQDLFPKEWRK